jgi:aspartate beta-hydroxylase
MASLYGRVGDGLRWIYDHRIDTPPVLDAQEHFPGGAAFAAAWRDIRSEALAVAATLDQVPRFHEIMREQTAISDNDGLDWRTFVMKAYGAKVPENIARCPTMAALLDEYPEVLSATFSYLAPGKHIPVHRGPFRGVLRFHIGLSMPRDGKGELGAILWIDGAPYRLDDGDSLLWDDTYPHEVLNATDRVRVALLLDVWRPGMPADMAALSSLLVGTVRMLAYMRPAAFVG